MPMIELAAMSPTAQLCLKSAARHQGLVYDRGGYVGRVACEGQTGDTFSAEPVGQLIFHQLMRCSAHDDLPLQLTQRGIDLLTQGRVYYVEVRS